MKGYSIPTHNSGLELQFSADERSLFFASTYTTLGNGETAKFWTDRWIDGRAISEIVPSLFRCVPKRRRKTTTVAAGLQDNNWARDIQGVLGLDETGQYLQLWQKIAHTNLTEAPDQLIWRWTANGSYSAKSCYAATFQGSMTSFSWKLIWKNWAPPRVEFFHWLADQDRCWTADRLARCGLQHPPRCPLCDQEPETIQHLLLHCPFTRQVWHEVLAWLGFTVPAPNTESSLMDWWLQAKQHTPKQMRKGLGSITLLTPWMVWKHRNDCVFEGAQPLTHSLIEKIKSEAKLWATAGAKGLRVILPSTWDVH